MQITEIMVIYNHMFSVKNIIFVKEFSKPDLY